MKSLSYLRTIALFMMVLIVSLPVAFAAQYNVQYDANGNVIYDEESDIYRIYNELNQLSETRINNASGTLLQQYIYDPLEERVLVKDEFHPDGSLKSSTIYFGDDYVVVKNESGIWNESYIHQDGTLVGILDERGNKKFILTDHLGSTDTILDSEGTILENTWTSPFGEIVGGGDQSRFNYESREFDEVTGDTDFRFRKYKQDWGMFLQPDTIIQNVYNPQSLNRYSFELNNPLKKTDPTGHIVVEGALVTWLVYSAATALLVAAGVMVGGGIIGPQIEKAYNSLKTYMEAKSSANLAASTTDTLNTAYRYLKNPTEENKIGFVKSFIGLALNLAVGKVVGRYAGSDAQAVHGASGTYDPSGGPVGGFFNAVANIGNTISTLSHAYNNQNISDNIKDSLIRSIISSAASGRGVKWYYDPTKGTYQYWVGSGKPNNPNAQKISGSTGSSSGESSGSSNTCNLVEINGGHYCCSNCG